MARSRILKPGFFTNETLAELSFEARLCFAGLWTLADRDGRLEDRPKRIAAALFPYDEIDMPAILDALAAKGFIERYTVESVSVIQIPTFDEHQHPHPRESLSVLPSRGKDMPSHVQAAPESVEATPRLPVSISTSVSTSNSVSVPAALPAARSKRPIFTGQRLTVFEWMLDDCRKTLGPLTDDFDLHSWFFALDALAAGSGMVIPPRDGGAWLLSQLVAEAGRRGLPIATAQPPPTAGKLTSRMAAAIRNAHAEAS